MSNNVQVLTSGPPNRNSLKGKTSNPRAIRPTSASSASTMKNNNIRAGTASSLHVGSVKSNNSPPIKVPKTKKKKMSVAAAGQLMLNRLQ